MAEFLTTRGTSSAIEKIINDAKDRLVLISPFVKIPDTLFQNLKQADSKGRKITLVYGKDELKPDVKNQLEQLNNLSLRFLKELHAKCFFNEESMVITSMNLYDFSEINNKEMGVLVTVKDDPGVFEKAREEADRIVESAVPIQLRSSAIGKFGKGIMKVGKLVSDKLTEDEPKRPKSRSYSYKPRTKKEGYCIRCKTSIPYNMDSPYCRDCWKKWKEGGENPDYRERDGKCHACGKPVPTSKAKPLCFSCLKKTR